MKKELTDLTTQKICEVCKTEYKVNKSLAKYRRTCSKTCKYKLLSIERAKTRIIKECGICGLEFTVPKCHENRRTCSNECRHKEHSCLVSKQETRVCKHCNSKYLVTRSSPRQFCSWECFKLSSKKNCIVCDRIIAKHRVFCSKGCMAAYYKMSLLGDKNPNWKGGMPVRPNSGVGSVLRTRIMERDNSCCTICGMKDWNRTPSLLHIHHIQELSKGGNESDQNLTTLCFICHWAGQHNFTLNESLHEIAKSCGCKSPWLSE